jgi:predicted DNA binding CopG/RHH family protein
MYGIAYTGANPMVQTDHKLTVRITEEEYRPVRVKAAALGVTVSSVVRALLAKWTNDEIAVALESLPEKQQN